MSGELVVNTASSYVRRLVPFRKNRFEHATSRHVSAVLERVKGVDEPSLLHRLFPDSMIEHATPSGYRYEKISERLHSGTAANVGYFGPHPSDLADFIGGLTVMSAVPAYEFLLTEGEKGAPPLSEETTRIIRRQETINSTSLQGTTLAYVRTPDGRMLSDGRLLNHIPELTVMMKERIRALDLSIIIAPAPEIDHPDHVAVHAGVVGALLQLAEEGYYKGRSLPALYITDPEFGYESGSEKTKLEVRDQLPTRYPADFSLRRGRDYTYMPYPFVVPQFIIDVSSAIGRATEALYAHQTQMKEITGEEKDYVDKIPVLKRVRGMQIGKGWGEGLRQYVIDGVTTHENTLLHVLPRGVMYELKHTS